MTEKSQKTTNGSFKSHSIQTLLARLVIFATGLGTSILIARSLGPEGRGTWAVMLLISSMAVMLVSLGLQPAATYYVGRQEFTLGEIVFALILLALILGLLPAFGFMIGLHLFPSFRGYLLANAINPIYMSWLLVLLPFSLSHQFITAALLGLRQFNISNLLAVFGSGLQFVLTVLLLMGLQLGIFGLIIEASVSAVVNIGLLCYFLQRMSLHRHDLRWNLAAGQAMIKYGTKAHLGSISWFMNYRADVFIISMYLSTAAVGYYSVSVGLAEKLYILPSVIGTVLFPYIASATEQEKRRLTPLVARQTNIMAWLSCGGMWLLAYPAIWLLYGADFLPAWPSTMILIPAIAVLSLGRIISSDLGGRGYPGLVSLINLFSGLANIGLNIWLIPWLGIGGAAIATLFSYSLAVVLELAAYVRITNIPATTLLIPTRADWQQYLTWIGVAKKHLNLKPYYPGSGSS
ncbi:MAG: hypothetical protein FOGNACKC_03207 [Anaerolineae bacterium]|nr:hypothetical protein [Anaerolineae bacterium]